MSIAAPSHRGGCRWLVVAASCRHARPRAAGAGSGRSTALLGGPSTSRQPPKAPWRFCCLQRGFRGRGEGDSTRRSGGALLVGRWRGRAAEAIEQRRRRGLANGEGTSRKQSGLANRLQDEVRQSQSSSEREQMEVDRRVKTSKVSATTSVYSAATSPPTLLCKGLSCTYTPRPPQSQAGRRGPTTPVPELVRP